MADGLADAMATVRDMAALGKKLVEGLTSGAALTQADPIAATLTEMLQAAAAVYTQTVELQAALASSEDDVALAVRAAHRAAADRRAARNLRESPLVAFLEACETAADSVCSADRLSATDRRSFRASCRAARHAGADLGLLLYALADRAAAFCLTRPQGIVDTGDRAHERLPLPWEAAGAHVLEQSSELTLVPPGAGSAALQVYFCAAKTADSRSRHVPGLPPPAARPRPARAVMAAVALVALDQRGAPPPLVFHAEGAATDAAVKQLLTRRAARPGCACTVSHHLDCREPAVVSAFVCAVAQPRGVVVCATPGGLAECLKDVCSFPAALVSTEGPWHPQAHLATMAPRGAPAVCLAARVYAYDAYTHSMCKQLLASTKGHAGLLSLLPQLKISGGGALAADLAAPPVAAPAAYAKPHCRVVFFGHHETAAGVPMLRLIASTHRGAGSRFSAATARHAPPSLTAVITDAAGRVVCQADTSLEQIDAAYTTRLRRTFGNRARGAVALSTLDVVTAAEFPGGIAVPPQARLRLMLSAGVAEARQDDLARQRSFTVSACRQVCDWDAQHSAAADADGDPPPAGAPEWHLSAVAGLHAVYKDLRDPPAPGRVACYFPVGAGVFRLDVAAAPSDELPAFVAAVSRTLQDHHLERLDVAEVVSEKLLDECTHVRNLAACCFQSTSLQYRLDGMINNPDAQAPLTPQQAEELRSFAHAVAEHAHSTATGAAPPACILQITPWRERRLVVLDTPLGTHAASLSRSQRFTLRAAAAVDGGAAHFKQRTPRGAMTVHCAMPTPAGLAHPAPTQLYVGEVFGESGHGAARQPLRASFAGMALPQLQERALAAGAAPARVYSLGRPGLVEIVQASARRALCTGSAAGHLHMEGALVSTHKGWTAKSVSLASVTPLATNCR
jgi:hypothetical protein